MTSCCKPSEYRRFFNRKFAQRDLARYRRRGLTSTEHDLVTLCHDLRGASVLEVGGGIGALQVELIDAGAARTTNVELSSGYEEAAEELRGDRPIERLVVDFVDADVPAHDIVLLHRVVCCYPDVDALIGSASARAGRLLAVTLPQQRRWIGWGARVVNGWLRLSRCGFRTYQHSFTSVADAAAAGGLHLERRVRRGLVWESASFVR